MDRKILTAIETADEKAVSLGISAVALVVRRDLASSDIKLTPHNLGLATEDSEKDRMTAEAIQKFANDIGRGSTVDFQVYVAGNFRHETELGLMLRKALGTIPKKKEG